MKPHIIYFQQNLAIGATEEYLYLLMEALDKNKFRVTFICPDSPTLDPLAEKLKIIDIPVYRYSSNINGAILILQLRKIFLKLKPSIIHFNDPCLNGIIAGRLAGLSKLVMTHHTPELNREYSLGGRLLEKIAFRHCGIYTIFTSEYDRQTGIEKDRISKEKSFTVYYGLPAQRFEKEYDKKDVYAEFSLDEQCQIIGNIARLSRQKGQKYLIEAAPQVIKKFKSLRFFFVGGGELESELKEQVRQNGLEDYFVFTGHRTDIPRLLSAFEALVMPSLFEGLCFAVIEAAAMGIPVIATAVGGMRCSVANGKTGLLVPARDTDALAKAILWVLEHPVEAKEMGLAGKKYFAENFTQEKMVKKTMQIYANLLRHP